MLLSCCICDRYLEKFKKVNEPYKLIKTKNQSQLHRCLFQYFFFIKLSSVSFFYRFHTHPVILFKVCLLFQRVKYTFRVVKDYVLLEIIFAISFPLFYKLLKPLNVIIEKLNDWQLLLLNWEFSWNNLTTSWTL